MLASQIYGPCRSVDQAGPFLHGPPRGPPRHEGHQREVGGSSQKNMAPAVGFEPTTNGLTVRCATAAPRRITIYGSVRSRSRLTSPHHFAAGGPGRNRTDVRGFAVLCMTTLPPGPRRPLYIEPAHRRSMAAAPLRPWSRCRPEEPWI